MAKIDLEFNKNEDQFKQLVFQLRTKKKKTRLGGGEKKIEEQHQKGKLTARERIQYLVDKNSDFLEIGLFTGEGMYKEIGGCPSGGVVTGIGHVEGRLCMIVANDRWKRKRRKWTRIIKTELLDFEMKSLPINVM